MKDIAIFTIGTRGDIQQYVKSIEELMPSKLNIIPISRYIVEQNPYWDKKNKIVSYLYNIDNNYEPEIS